VISGISQLVRLQQAITAVFTIIQCVGGPLMQTLLFFRQPPTRSGKAQRVILPLASIVISIILLPNAKNTHILSLLQPFAPLAKKRGMFAVVDEGTDSILAGSGEIRDARARLVRGKVATLGGTLRRTKKATLAWVGRRGPPRMCTLGSRVAI